MHAPHIDSDRHRDYVPAREDTTLRFCARMQRRRDDMQTDPATARFRVLTRAHSERRT